ncbi:hypothetical protein AB1Y20_016020 [Prymnesium parvum]|uniref:Uncharacterized protein n=1 Tax=Prymnesium parvum TaxID=97485 RepID=A0AB34K320_PRYPA
MSRQLSARSDGDFGAEEALLLNVSEDLPAERLRSIGRYLLEEVYMAGVRHRSQPAAEQPDIMMAIVADMSGEVFHHRRQEYLQLEALAREAAERATESLMARLAAIEF